MSGKAIHGIGHLIYRGEMLSAGDFEKREEIVRSMQYLYRVPEKRLRAELFLADMTGLLGRAMRSLLLAFGLDGLRQRLVRRLLNLGERQEQG